MRRLAVALLLLGALACPGGRPEPSPSPVARPAGSGVSILLITIDTLRADHLGTYGYRRPTSPRIDAWARTGTVFERAYTYWPKTRGSFAMIHTGRRASLNGYSKAFPGIPGFNATLASVLKDAGYATAASVDNPNVAAQHGYDKGFETYRETWREEALQDSEVARSRAITADAVALLSRARAEQPLFLWLHYVNPHAPYTPPAPYDTAFLDADAEKGPRLRPVDGFHGGVRKEWAVRGRERLGYYVAQYDGEIAAVDQEVGQVLDALARSAVRDRTLVLLTSDHGESLGEHDYYFDHGEDLFDPCLHVPLIVSGPGVPAGRSQAWASTLDLLPTALDAAKVSYPPDLSGTSLLPGGAAPGRRRLFARNDRSLAATFDERSKLVVIPRDDGRADFTLHARSAEEPEIQRPEELREHRREFELVQEREDKEWGHTSRALGTGPAPVPVKPEDCEKLRALGYLNVPGCE